MYDCIPLMPLIMLDLGGFEHHLVFVKCVRMLAGINAFNVSTFQHSTFNIQQPCKSLVLALFDTTEGASRHIGRTMTGAPAGVAPHVVRPRHQGGTIYSISSSGSADRLAASCAIHMAVTLMHANYELHSTLGNGESLPVVLPGTHINSMRSLLSY